MKPEGSILFPLHRLAANILVGVLLLSCSGCITASLATLGTVAGLLSSAASTGADVYKLGKLDAAVMATLPEVKQAARHTACDLGLELATNGRTADPRSWQATLIDDQKREITITFEPRSARLCLCRVDVGIFGSEPTAKLIMERIRSHLPDTTGPTTQPTK